MSYMVIAPLVAIPDQGGHLLYHHHRAILPWVPPDRVDHLLDCNLIAVLDDDPAPEESDDAEAEFDPDAQFEAAKASLADTDTPAAAQAEVGEADPATALAEEPDPELAADDADEAATAIEETEQERPARSAPIAVWREYVTAAGLATGEHAATLDKRALWALAGA